ncbi:MAG TPA: hypothetical protein VN897_14360, partial [Mycobacterium sp.]|nr:hypothetical protein [Mycobacterium sp.]
CVPYPRETDAGIMHAHLTEPPPTLPVAAGADSDFHSVFARGMAKDPGARYGHAGDLINAAALSADRMPSIRRKTVPAFPGEPREQAGATPEFPDEPHRQSDAAPAEMPVADGTEIVSRAELAKLYSAESHTAADRRRTPAPEPTPQLAKVSGRRWLMAAIGIGAIAAVVAIVLVLGSGGGTHAKVVRHESSVESAKLAQLADQLSQSLAPSVAARDRQTGLSSAHLSTRAATARAIAGADRRSATALTRLSPQPRSQQAVSSLARALENERSALSKLAGAAATDDSSAYSYATVAIQAAGRQLSSARAALDSMGFKNLPALRALSTPRLPRVHHRRRSQTKPVPATSAPVDASPAPESTVAAKPAPAPSAPTQSAPAPTHHSSPQPHTEVAKPLS